MVTEFLKCNYDEGKPYCKTRRLLGKGKTAQPFRL